MNLKTPQNDQSYRLPFILFCLILLIFSLAAQKPAEIPYFQSQETPTPMPATPEVSETTLMSTETITPTTTPFPDWAMTSKDTNGLLVSGILILLIIIVGTLTAMTRNIPHPQNYHQ